MIIKNLGGKWLKWRKFTSLKEGFTAVEEVCINKNILKPEKVKKKQKPIVCLIFKNVIKKRSFCVGLDSCQASKWYQFVAFLPCSRLPERMGDNDWPSTPRKFTIGDNLTEAWLRKICSEQIWSGLWKREKSVKSLLNIEKLGGR